MKRVYVLCAIVLLDAAGLSNEMVEEARSRAASLANASADATLEGTAKHLDAPPVNAAEGRVLVEMREAMRLFGEANERTAVVPKLIPGPATRHVLGARRSSGGSESPGPSAPTPPQPS